MLFCFSSCGGLPAIPGVPWLVNTSLCLNLHLHTAFSLLCLGPDFLLLLRTRVTGLGFTLMYDLILITSAKTLFPKEVIFTSARGQDFRSHSAQKHVFSTRPERAGLRWPCHGTEPLLQPSVCFRTSIYQGLCPRPAALMQSLAGEAYRLEGNRHGSRFLSISGNPAIQLAVSTSIHGGLDR